MIELRIEELGERRKEEKEGEKRREEIFIIIFRSCDLCMRRFIVVIFGVI